MLFVINNGHYSRQHHMYTFLIQETTYINKTKLSITQIGCHYNCNIICNKDPDNIKQEMIIKLILFFVKNLAYSYLTTPICLTNVRNLHFLCK